MVSIRALSTAVVCATSAFLAAEAFHLKSGGGRGRSGSPATDSALVAHLSLSSSSSSSAAAHGIGRHANATTLEVPNYEQESQKTVSVLTPEATPLGNVRDPRHRDEGPLTDAFTSTASLVHQDDPGAAPKALPATDGNSESKSSSRTPNGALLIPNDVDNADAKEVPSLQSLIRSVNYFISRKCNYSCQFCFHTQKTTHHLALGQAEAGLKLLREAGCEKINFAGGEPFVHASLLGQLCRISHQMGLAVSIISNGSLITDRWMREYGRYVDVLGVSVDSFDPDTNAHIGRGGDANNRHADRILRVRDMCADHSIKFKMNTVVCSLNWRENMSRRVVELHPDRWKVFQVLVLEQENAGGPNDLRDARPLQVTDDQYWSFVRRHQRELASLSHVLIPEPNDVMRDSYLLLDEDMRFLDCSSGAKIPGESILKVGVERALMQAGFDHDMFVQRGGVYDWTRDRSANAN